MSDALPGMSGISSFAEGSRALPESVYLAFREAVAIGKWPDGRTLTEEQKALCLEAILLYESEHVPEGQRTGYVPPKDACTSSNATASTGIDAAGLIAARQVNHDD